MLLLALTSISLADTLVTTNSRTKIAGNPARTATLTAWIGADRMAQQVQVVEELQLIIIRKDQKKGYLIDTAGKRYVEFHLPCNMAGITETFFGLSPEMSAEVLAAFERERFTANVTPTDQTRKVGTWNAKLYRAQVKSAQGEKVEDIDLWMTKEIPIDDLAAYKTLQTCLHVLDGREALGDALAKIDGIAVLTEATWRNNAGNKVDRRDEIVSAETKTPPAGTYDVPSGFTKDEVGILSVIPGFSGSD